MRRYRDPAFLTPEQRFSELTAILAAGVVRALRRPTVPDRSGEHLDPKKPLESAEVSLELVTDSRLSVSVD